jgi:hypothetical protein
MGSREKRRVHLPVCTAMAEGGDLHGCSTGDLHGRGLGRCALAVARRRTGEEVAARRGEAREDEQQHREWSTGQAAASSPSEASAVREKIRHIRRRKNKY